MRTETERPTVRCRAITRGAHMSYEGESLS